MPQIEVTADIDANGILHVGAKDLGSARNRRSASPPAAASRRTKSRRCARMPSRTPTRSKTRLEEIQTRNEADNCRLSHRKIDQGQRGQTGCRRQGQARSRRQRGEGSAQRQRRLRHQILQRETQRSLAGRLDGYCIRPLPPEAEADKGAGRRATRSRTAQVRRKRKTTA